MRRVLRPVLSAAAVALFVLAPASHAHAQQSPPPGAGQPPAGPPASVSAAAHEHLLTAGAAVAKEAAALLQLGAFAQEGPRIAPAVAPVNADARGGEALDQLKTADAAGPQLLRTLQADGVPLPPEATAVLATLSAANRSAASANRKISIGAETYLLALDELLLEDGGPPVGPPDPAAVAPALRGAASSSSGGAGFPFLWVAVGIVVLALGTAFVVRGRRRPTPSRDRGPSFELSRPVPQQAAVGPPAGMPGNLDDLLEVSRRLTAATASNGIERAVVREAMGLVPSTAAALVFRQAERLVVGHQSPDDVIVVDRLGDGVIGRVAETGQPVSQVSATEPAVRYLPVSLVAVPLVGGGRVDAVLILVRSPHSPFDAADRERLAALAPVAAAAIQSARHAAAAVEDSLVDPLTGVGNRRRFDAELHATLRHAQGRPTSVVMVDLDRFKLVNDTHGHQTGDAVLRAAAATIRSATRPSDGVYRYGGEEFAMVLPYTELAAAVEIAERVRAAIGAAIFDVGATQPLRVTASLGVACRTGADVAELVSRADAALYRAKELGRDRVVADDRSVPLPRETLAAE